MTGFRPTSRPPQLCIVIPSSSGASRRWRGPLALKPCGSIPITATSMLRIDAGGIDIDWLDGAVKRRAYYACRGAGPRGSMDPT